VKRSSRIALAGARGRLLPVSLPFRYFGAAVVFHLCAWLALLPGASLLPRFSGGLTWPLAALHLVTLGVLVMTAMGASLQLMPVATRQPVHSQRGPAMVWWLYTPGVAMVALGMGFARPGLLAAGALAVTLALVAYAALLGRNLVGARGMPGVVAHGGVAVVSLLVVIVTALALALAMDGASVGRVRVALTGTNSRPLLLAGTGAFAGASVDEALLAALAKLVQKQVSPMRTTLTASNWRRSVAAVTARRLVADLAAMSPKGRPEGESAPKRVSAEGSPANSRGARG